MHACIYVCMYACMYACMDVCMYVYIYVYMYIYITNRERWSGGRDIKCNIHSGMGPSVVRAGGTLNVSSIL